MTVSAQDAGYCQIETEPAPSVWLLGALAGLLILKVAVIDPSTTLFRCVSTEQRVCGAQATTNADFVDAPSLRGYTIHTAQVRPGDQLRLDLYWEGIAAPRELSTFIHIRPSAEGQPGNPNTENGMWAEAGTNTPAGILTKEWQPNKLYLDDYRLTLPADIPPGRYFLEVGWFDDAQGEQVDVVAETLAPDLRILWRSVLLPDIEVVAP